MPERRYVFAFDHPHDRSRPDLPDLLGGKGANLAEMVAVLGLPVPPGFTVTTEACRRFLSAGRPDGLAGEVDAALAELGRASGRRFGDPADPLLVSVRSGARRSMPGMMDTVLDLGLNDESVTGLAARTDERFAYDTYRRFVACFARVVLGLPGEPFEQDLAAARAEAGSGPDGRWSAATARRVLDAHLGHVHRLTGAAFPQDHAAQLWLAVDAVFRSWHSARARAYREREGIPHDLGTAVTVQAMVFGNRDDRSGSGVAFSRDPATGEAVPYGDVLLGAQGEDVVAGAVQPAPLATLADWAPAAHDELLTILRRLEVHHRDLVDVEFTVEAGRLWILQARVGARTGAAAVRIAVELHDDPAIGLSRTEALARVGTEQVEQVLRPTFGRTGTLVATGLAASPGSAVGRVYFSADEALDAHERGEDVILVRVETSPEDIAGFEVAAGVLTSRGGLASHAAVVARGWGIPAVVGAEAIVIGDHAFSVGPVTVPEGTVIAIDGSTGAVMLDAPPPAVRSVPEQLETLLGWADDVVAGRFAVSATVASPDEVALARSLGAAGIGPYRPDVQGGDVVDVVGRLLATPDPLGRQQVLDDLGRTVRPDLDRLLAAAGGLPLTVTLAGTDPDRAGLAGTDGDPAGTVPGDDRRPTRREAAQAVCRIEVSAAMGAVRARRAAGQDAPLRLAVPATVPDDVHAVRAWVAAVMADAESVTAPDDRGGTGPAGTGRDPVGDPVDGVAVGAVVGQAIPAPVVAELARVAEFVVIRLGPDPSPASAPVEATVAALVAAVRQARPGSVVSVAVPVDAAAAVGGLVAAGVDEVCVPPEQLPPVRLAVARWLLAAAAGHRPSADRR